MTVRATRRTTELVGAAPSLDGVVRAFACLIQSTRPDASLQASYLWLLACIAAGGAVVRFLGLGDVGLHGDEETMALAVRGILADGVPILPSGMFYPRGLTQLYLMAGAVALFGESEWALRLPSAVCGVVLIVLSCFVGLRFLRPYWSAAFAAAIAFLPTLIVDSQTARMYIFMMTFVVAAMGCVFAWERTRRTSWLIAAVAMFVLGLDMHALAIGAALVLLLPGLVRGDSRQLRLGVLGVIAVGVSYLVIHSWWVSSHYPSGPPPELETALASGGASGRALASRNFSLGIDLAFIGAGVAIAGLALHAARTAPLRWARSAAALLISGVVLQLALYYHLAALAYAAGGALALRHGGASAARRLAIMLIAVATLLAAHAAVLAAPAGTFIRLVGALVGRPSVWPYVRIAELSVGAAVLTGALLIWGIYRLTRGERAPDYWLLAVLGVWAPVFALGVFAWNVPPRYTEVALAPMMLCAFAFAQHGCDAFAARWSTDAARRRLSLMGAGLAAIVVANPAATAAVVNAGYAIHPDHKGAAEFMRTQHITDDDVVLAEDVLQQTYYLGRVDYWLIGPRVARRYVELRDADVVDIYTGTPVIATPAMLEEVLEKNAGKRIFVIGTGEGWRSGRRPVREGLHELLESDRFMTVYQGRDGRTRVLRAVSSVAHASTAAKAQQRVDRPEAAAASSGAPVEDDAFVTAAAE